MAAADGEPATCARRCKWMSQVFRIAHLALQKLERDLEGSGCHREVFPALSYEPVVVPAFPSRTSQEK